VGSKSSLFESPNPRPGFFIPVKRPRKTLHGRLRQFTHAHTIFPVGRTNCDVTCVSTSAALQLWESNRYQCALLRDLIEVGHTFPLGIAVLQEPCFAFKCWRCIGIERFVSAEKNLPFEVKEFQRIELDARKLRSGAINWHGTD
jgi:hypothetical protein